MKPDQWKQSLISYWFDCDLWMNKRSDADNYVVEYRNRFEVTETKYYRRHKRTDDATNRRR